MEDWYGKAIISFRPDLIVSSDVSKLGWSAALRAQRIQGQWRVKEKNLHIHEPRHVISNNVAF